VLNNAATNFACVCIQIIQKGHSFAETYTNTINISLEKTNKKTPLLSGPAALSSRSRTRTVSRHVVFTTQFPKIIVELKKP